MQRYKDIPTLKERQRVHQKVQRGWISSSALCKIDASVVIIIDKFNTELFATSEKSIERILPLF